MAYDVRQQLIQATNKLANKNIIDNDKKINDEDEDEEEEDDYQVMQVL